MFPIHTKSHAVRAPLPAHRIIEMETPAENALSIESSDRQASLRNSYPRRADSQASLTVLLLWRNLARADEKVRNPEIIDQRRAEYAGKA